MLRTRRGGPAAAARRVTGPPRDGRSVGSGEPGQRPLGDRHVHRARRVDGEGGGHGRERPSDDARCRARQRRSWQHRGARARRLDTLPDSWSTRRSTGRPTRRPRWRTRRRRFRGAPGLRVTITPGSGKPPSTGYYLVESLSEYVFAFDGAGAVRWYHASQAPSPRRRCSATERSPRPRQHGRLSAAPRRVHALLARGTSLGSYTVTSPDPSEPGSACRSTRTPTRCRSRRTRTGRSTST